MQRLEIPSPAKLNLYLKVVNKREDGYHEIVTVFERIDLLDYVLIEKIRSGIRLDCRDKGLPLPEQNLAYKAALLFSKKIGKSLGVKIKILKNIPIGAGLGGGSSNAAAVFSGINRLYEVGLDKAVLFRWAKEIGSDLGFFLSGKSFALGKGRGERIFPLDTKLKLRHILIYPNVRVYTKNVYDSLGIGLTRKAPDVRILLKALRSNQADLVNKGLFNSLEDIAEEKYRAISFWKKKLFSLGIERVLVSGSGSSIFGIIPDRNEAEETKKKLEVLKRGKIFIVSTY